jgi:hypothetical protein
LPAAAGLKLVGVFPAGLDFSVIEFLTSGGYLAERSRATTSIRVRSV